MVVAGLTLIRRLTLIIDDVVAEGESGSRGRAGPAIE
jgi:hypothetical protein